MTLGIRNESSGSVNRCRICNRGSRYDWQIGVDHVNNNLAALPKQVRSVYHRRMYSTQIWLHTPETMTSVVFKPSTSQIATDYVCPPHFVTLEQIMATAVMLHATV